jgi:hypothetical protein
MVLISPKLACTLDNSTKVQEDSGSWFEMPEISISGGFNGDDF